MNEIGGTIGTTAEALPGPAEAQQDLATRWDAGARAVRWGDWQTSGILKTHNATEELSPQSGKKNDEKVACDKILRDTNTAPVLNAQFLVLKSQNQGH